MIVIPNSIRNLFKYSDLNKKNKGRVSYNKHRSYNSMKIYAVFIKILIMRTKIIYAILIKINMLKPPTEIKSDSEKYITSKTALISSLFS